MNRLAAVLVLIPLMLSICPATAQSIYIGCNFGG